jgi:hypothetical protein
MGIFTILALRRHANEVMRGHNSTMKNTTVGKGDMHMEHMGGLYDDMSDAWLKKRLEELRNSIRENDVRDRLETWLSLAEIRASKSEAYEIQCIMRDRGLSFTPVRVDSPEILSFLFSLPALRAACECPDRHSSPCAVHSGR